MLTPEELRQIQRLHIQAGRNIDSLAAGEYRSAFKGSGMEFEEVRPYVPGDDVRWIDWNVTARSDEPYVKEFREERELTMLLILDVSGSVRFGGGGQDGRTDKRLQVARVAGGLAYAALRSSDRVGLLRFTDRVETFLPPRKSRGHGWEVIRAAFEGAAASPRTDLGLALEHANRILKRRSVVVILSDFLSPPRFTDPLRALSRRHRVHAFLFHDPLEAAMPPAGLVALEDAETGALVTVDAGRVRAARAEEGGPPEPRGWWQRLFSRESAPERAGAAEDPVSPGTVEERTALLRRHRVRVTAVSTRDDAFLKLHQHFRGGR